MSEGSDQERQKTLDHFGDAVNMTARELEKWLALRTIRGRTQEPASRLLL